MDLKRSFPPEVRPDARVLILGSLPGVRSLEAQQYYAHPQNGFWRLIGGVVGENLAVLPYAERLEVLMARRVGLWDVVETARRDGSLDGAIRDHRPNDLIALIETLPDLRAIGFNGQTAARIGRRIVREGAIALIDLPSSSPAYTLAFAAKVEAWRALKAFL